MEHAWLEKDEQYLKGSVAAEVEKYEVDSAYRKRKISKRSITA